MLQYILTGLAGLALGVVAMRIWQLRNADTAPDSEGETGTAAPNPATRTRNLLIGAGVLAVLGLAIFLFRPNESPSSPTSAVAMGDTAGLADVDTMIARLAERLESDPQDGEGFRMLGWSYVMTGSPEKAIAPYERALELLPDSATVHAGYGEALVGVSGGTVTDKAKAEFDKAQAIDPAEPRSRYFLAMWLEQQGRKRQALDQWLALANDGPADAPWQADLRNQIDKTSRELGVDVSGKLAAPAPESGTVQPSPADMASVTALPPAAQQAAIEDMVEGLSRKLQANPADAEGWLMLLRSRMVLNQPDQAAKDLTAARKALAGDAQGLARVEDAASGYGVPGAR